MKTYLCAALCLLMSACDRPVAEPVPAISTAIEAPSATPDARTAQLLGSWRIRHTIHQTGEEVSEPLSPIVPTVWTFEADGTFDSPALKGRYSLAGDRLTMPPTGGEPYLVQRLDKDRLEVVFEIASVGIRNTTVLDRFDPNAPASAAPTPDRPMTASEQALVGTWIATVGKDASTSKMMAGGALLGLGGGNLVDGVVDAIEKGRTIPTNCIWVELRADFTGQRCACALMNGEPSLLETTNIMTGEKTALGGGLTWKMPDGGPLQLTLAEAHVVPRTIDGVETQLEFTQWHLKLLSSAGGELQVQESFPEHDFALAGPQTYEVFPGAFLSE